MSESEFSCEIVGARCLICVDELSFQKVTSKEMRWDSKSNLPVKDVLYVECFSKLDWWDGWGAKMEPEMPVTIDSLIPGVALVLVCPGSSWGYINKLCGW